MAAQLPVCAGLATIIIYIAIIHIYIVPGVPGKFPKPLNGYYKGYRWSHQTDQPPPMRVQPISTTIQGLNLQQVTDHKIGTLLRYQYQYQHLSWWGGWPACAGTRASWTDSRRTRRWTGEEWLGRQCYWVPCHHPHTRETIRMNAAQLLDEYPTAGAGCEETFSMRKVSIAMHCCPFSNDTLNGG